mmetsp:Transcript_23052/g.27748  ORF Transcript_23052/g.27748 Transcript_23052/m.27748 type:complete len:96 (+) Transcript_23052:109-396(+)|eukprot:CAMPEP_0195260546 /NCGR_PEP_ID=MMETSP0706-20130129/8635_1 /TAXON_ID=33640 /ORGANISM="Asterionellopsis glacialis, Strain CCMP134" /LENGTH=95 /DNA_ID=CAMNT_0040314279 /DNA_START=899 /DNA_END=1186 /DNA_ORIENTATION=+
MVRGVGFSTVVYHLESNLEVPSDIVNSGMVHAMLKGVVVLMSLVEETLRPGRETNGAKAYEVDVVSFIMLNARRKMDHDNVEFFMSVCCQSEKRM